MLFQNFIDYMYFLIQKKFMNVSPYFHKKAKTWWMMNFNTLCNGAKFTVAKSTVSMQFLPRKQI